ncbi:MAG: cation:proton antiporter [Granulosicoccaceae bacterium]|jgi:Kef-type K+ transport system membrane component KefB
MDTHVLLFTIALILLAARLFAELAQALGAPAIIGELAAGVILGPSLLGWITPNDVLILLAEIGIVLLLFEAGLETDFERLLKAGPFAVILALAGFVLPFALGFACSYLVFEQSLLVSLFIGGTLTATSIGITVRILTELGRNREFEGQIVLGAAVLDDILGVLLLAMLYEYASNGAVSLENTGRITFLVIGFFILAPVVARLFSLVLKRFHSISDMPGLIPVSVVTLVLFFAALSHHLGAPQLLGGFAAGIALSRRFFLPFAASLRTDPDFTRRIHIEMKPIIQLFTPVFFVMVGLSLDLQSIDWGSTFIWGFSISMAILALGGKLAAGWLVPVPFPLRNAIGMAMVPRGEVGLIFAELGRVAGIFNNEVYAALVIVIAYTTLFAPFWMKFYYRINSERIAAADALMTQRTTGK